MYNNVLILHLINYQTDFNAKINYYRTQWIIYLQVYTYHNANQMRFILRVFVNVYYSSVISLVQICKIVLKSIQKPQNIL